MKLYKSTAKIREYCDYIDEHAYNVMEAWKTFQNACKNMNVVYDDHLWATIDEMIKSHDISKVSSEEFIQYQQKFYPVGESDSTGFDSAMAHHFANNPHHPQNWTKIKSYAPNELACHCVCMVCDWMAMSKKFGDTAEKYYESHKDKIPPLPEWAVNFLDEIFEALRQYSSEKSPD